MGALPHTGSTKSPSGCTASMCNKQSVRRDLCQLRNEWRRGGPFEGQHNGAYLQTRGRDNVPAINYSYTRRQLHRLPPDQPAHLPEGCVRAHLWSTLWGRREKLFSTREATVSRVTSNLWNNYSSTDQLLSRILTFFLNVELELNCLVSTSQTIPHFNQPLGPSLFSVRMCMGRVANPKAAMACVLGKGTRGGSSGPGVSGV
jgi:hypothetical protein